MTTLDLAKEWLRYAKSDLNTAKHMFNDVNPKETDNKQDVCLKILFHIKRA
jgi:hypothetical protein